MTESVTYSFVKFSELKLTTVDRCSSANCPVVCAAGPLHFSQLRFTVYALFIQRSVVYCAQSYEMQVIY